jgi:RNA polymerase sigma-70 factor, ECF subfamily
MSRRSVDSFGSLYDEHVWQVYGFFGYRLGSREDAEDLTQLTFERALKAWDRFDDQRASAGTWLIAIARNLLIDHHRRDGSRLQVATDPEELAETAPAIEPPQEGGIGISHELEAALGCLSQRGRELVALRFGADLTGPEIAELTGLSLANVQQILSRSLRRLRAEMEPPGTPEEPRSGHGSGAD